MPVFSALENELMKRTTAMATIPNSDAEQKFQAMLANLLNTQSAWSEKQQLELEMARDISVEMLRLAESMRDTGGGLESMLTLLKYAKVMDFILTTLASRREIRPQTLRVIFKLAGLKVDEAYPG
jgi:hypoxanthine-guanine phosphoribosyltransferase